MASHFAQGNNKRKGAPARRGVPQIQRYSRDAGHSQATGHSRAEASYYAAARRGGSRGGGSGRGKKVGIAVGVLLAVLLVVGGTCGVLLYRSAMSVRDRASATMAQVDVVKEALKTGDSETLDAAVGDIQEQVAAINAEVHTPLWGLATLVPVIGQDISSVQKFGDAAVVLVDDALVPIADSVSGVGLSSLFNDGEVNVELLQTLSDTLSGSLPAIQESVDTIASLPEAHIPQLAEVFDRVQGPVAEMRGIVANAEPILKLLPQIFGADGSRTYLVIAQNNAELRSLGGLPGSWGTISIDDGKISMGEFESIIHHEDLGRQVDLTDEELNAAHVLNMGKDSAQLNYLPDFARVGELANEFWAQEGNDYADGVIAVDPVFLQRLLALTGGFEAPDGTTVDGTNAAGVLMSDTYWKLGNDSSAQDEYFSAVASLAFGHVMNHLGEVGLTDLMGVVQDSGEDGRLLVWMANEDEQAFMEQLGVDGELGDDPAKPQLGVFLNDDTYSKISWYASCYTEIGEGVRNADGTITYDVTTTLTNTITESEAAAAPSYVSGVHATKRSASDMLNHVFIVAPAGGTISNFSVSEGAVSDDYGVVETTLYGHQFIRTSTHLLGGESAVFTYQVTVSAEATEPLSLRTTPLAQESLMQAPSE